MLVWWPQHGSEVLVSLLWPPGKERMTHHENEHINKNFDVTSTITAAAAEPRQPPPPPPRRRRCRARPTSTAAASPPPLQSPAAASTAARAPDLREGEGVVAASKGDEGGAEEKDQRWIRAAWSTASRSERREPGSTVDDVEVGATLPVVRRRRIRPPRGSAAADPASLPAPESRGSWLSSSRIRRLRPSGDRIRRPPGPSRSPSSPSLVRRGFQRREEEEEEEEEKEWRGKWEGIKLEEILIEGIFFFVVGAS
ncbi:hypothetical protein DAI22_06g137501 [Oryza sativa Japonica Group]|nr:hypothetical protein DAI22_06g137501 [Oryza sativa Japonica Group]